MATIERDNRILLEKMSFVMRTRGRVDNRNDYEHKSLNKTKRQRELLRVTHENQVIEHLFRNTQTNCETRMIHIYFFIFTLQAILKRISSKEPHYNHLQWVRI